MNNNKSDFLSKKKKRSKPLSESYKSSDGSLMIISFQIGVILHLLLDIYQKLKIS